MPTFSKFITGRRGSQQLVDSDGYIYSRKKDKDSALKSAWRCSKHCIPTKCPCLCYLTLSDNALTLSKKTHTHEADIAAPERQEVLVSLKRKAADQPLSATQNLISEALVETSPAVNQILPNMMSLARVIQDLPNTRRLLPQRTSLSLLLVPPPEEMNPLSSTMVLQIGESES